MIPGILLLSDMTLISSGKREVFSLSLIFSSCFTANLSPESFSTRNTLMFFSFCFSLSAPCFSHSHIERVRYLFFTLINWALFGIQNRPQFSGHLTDLRNCRILITIMSYRRIIYDCHCKKSRYEVDFFTQPMLSYGEKGNNAPRSEQGS